MSMMLLMALGVGGLLLYTAGKERGKDEPLPKTATDIEGLDPALAAEVDQILSTSMDPAELTGWAQTLEALGLPAADTAAAMLRARAEELLDASTEPPLDVDDGKEPPPVEPRPGPPPTDEELQRFAQAGDDLANLALTQCPDKTAEISSAHQQFAIDIVADPQVAYRTLETTLQSLCPGVVISTPPQLSPRAGSGDPQVDLANSVVDALDAVGCMNVDPALIGDFQRSAGIPQTGVYDFDTAVALAPLVGDRPPGPCRFPEWEASVGPSVAQQIAGWVSRLDQFAV